MQSDSSGSETQGPEAVPSARAGFWRRLAGSLLDGLPLALTAGALRIELGGAGAFVVFVLSLAYFTGCEGGKRGQTLGKRAVGVRVIALDTGRSIGYRRAALRWFGRFVSTIVFFLGYLWMLWDSEKQCWHDNLANDVVVPTRG